MNLARKKICLQVPADAKPNDWPVGWEFPPLNAWPPGYPQVLKDAVTLDAIYTPDKKLVVWCLDKHGEHTDLLAGKSFLVKACNSARVHRIRQPGTDHWSEYGIFKICEFEPCKWGIHVDLEVERIGPIVVHVFGYELGHGTSVTVKS